MFSLTGYRQVLSVAIGIFWGYEMIKKRKLIAFTLLILIAGTLHKSTVFFFVFYFISQFKLSKKYVFTVAFVVVICIIGRVTIFNMIKGIVGYDQYGSDNGFQQKNFLLLLIMFTCVAIWRYKYIIKVEPKAKVYYNGLIMSFLLFPIAMVDPSGMRLVYDFAFFLMLLLPLIMKSFPLRNDKRIAYAVIITMFAYFVLTKTPKYLYYWQDVIIYF